MEWTRLRSDLAALRWYVRRPSTYGQFSHHLRRRLSNLVPGVRAKVNADWQAGEAWCAATAVSTETALRALGLPERVEAVSTLYRSEWEAATRAAESTPVPMGGAGDVDLLYHLCAQPDTSQVIETGVAYGWSSLAILLALESKRAGSLVSIDMPYPGRGNEAFVGCVVPATLRPRWKLVRRPDRDALEPELAEIGRIDLAHYDSDKSYGGRMFAYPLLWGALRPGGILMSDDIGDNLGFKDFAAHVGAEPCIVEKKRGGYVGLLRRPVA